MITLRLSSRTSDLLTLLSYVGEFPYSDLYLLGSKESWRKLLAKLSQQQEYRLSDSGERITCQLLKLSGKGKTKTIRMTKAAVSILERLNPDAAYYYTQTYLQYNPQGSALRIDRAHRVAEAIAFVRWAGIETNPCTLPQLQMLTIKKVVPDEPSFYISNELKYVGDDDVNKTSFSRVTGALFYPGGCYAVYNSRDQMMEWNGKGESKLIVHLSEIARMNASIDGINSAILLGASYKTADLTLRALDRVRKPANRFDKVYDCLHFIPLDSFGARLLRLLTLPDWKESVLDVLFEEEDRSYAKGNFSYDAYEDGVYVMSFLDSDIARLVSFRDSTVGQQFKLKIICFPEQAEFLRGYLGYHVHLKTVTMNQIEEALLPEGEIPDE